MRLPVKPVVVVSCLTILLAAGAAGAGASDWPRFRGPNGSGVSPDEQPTPVKWSDTENLKWKAKLPGPGHSSPIVVGDRVFVTCWTGYGVDQGNPGDQKDLKRHLICIDRKSGDIVWDKAVPAVLPEDRYGGQFAQHGYATHTPVSDGEKVFVFFGKTGVLAFDMEGQQLWKKEVGSDLNRMGWGSSSSPILYKDKVIVTASAENHALVALDKNTGKEVWKEEADGFGNIWGTPVIVKVSDDRTDLVLGAPYEVWGFNPDTGKLRWYCEALEVSSMTSSLVAHEGVVYGIESFRGGGSVAVRVGGKNDITKSNIVWTSREGSRTRSPVVYDGMIYWVANGKILNVTDAKTGKRVSQKRLTGATASGNRGQNRGGREAGAQPRRGRGQGGFGFGQRRRGGYGGGQDYASPVIADGKMYFVASSGDTFVAKLGKEIEQLAVNSLKDGGDFAASPAISNGEIFIRSTKCLYCVAEK